MLMLPCKCTNFGKWNRVKLLDFYEEDGDADGEYFVVPWCVLAWVERFV